MEKSFERFKKDVKVRVDDCYLSDEVTRGINTSPVATVFSEPSDSEELVGIQYQSGEIDYVPQNILEVFEGFTRIITLPVFGIIVTINVDENHKPISGTITSPDLKTEYEDEEDELYNAAMDGIESMILAHAMAEIDITSAAYLEGIETAVNSCANNF